MYNIGHVKLLHGELKVIQTLRQLIPTDLAGQTCQLFLTFRCQPPFQYGPVAVANTILACQISCVTGLLSYRIPEHGGCYGISRRRKAVPTTKLRYEKWDTL